jgi:hypothetical protein
MGGPLSLKVGRFVESLAVPMFFRSAGSGAPMLLDFCGSGKSSENRQELEPANDLPAVSPPDGFVLSGRLIRIADRSRQCALVEISENSSAKPDE